MSEILETSIGGYHELSLPDYSQCDFGSFIKVNSARSALKLILRSIPVDKLWIPSYICKSVVDAVEESDVAYSFYALDYDFSIPTGLRVQKNEFIFCVDYFGLCKGSVSRAIRAYGPGKVLVDNSQAFFSTASNCVANIFSPRKFFGLPDGGLLYSDDARIQQPEVKDESSESRTAHLISRLTNSPEAGYQKYLEAEESISSMPVLGMSELTERLLHSIDYEAARQARIRNALRLHEKLKHHNRLQLHLADGVAPLCYPFLPKENGITRGELIKKRIFVPCYWPEVIDKVEKSSFEWDLVRSGLFLPCDQRCNENDMDYLVNALGLL